MEEAERLARREHPAEGGAPARRARSEPVHLVVVVDLDDDVSEAGYPTPIIGEENVLRAAVDFALLRPEDSDANAMFAGLQLYRKLKAEGKRAEIAVVSGVREDRIDAQRRVKEQVRSLADVLGGNVELYLVSDGDEDLLVADVLMSVAPIAAIKRVVVEQHLGIEGGVILLARYVKKALLEERFSRYTLGIPGLILLVWAVLSIAGYGDVFSKAATLIVGAAMIFKGFGLEEHVAQFARDLVNRPPLALAGMLVMSIFTLASVVSAYYAAGQQALVTLGEILRTSVPLFATGMIAYTLIARVIYKVTRGDLDVFDEAAFLVLVSFIAVAFYKLGNAVLVAAAGAETSEAVVQALLSSGFVELALMGASISGIIELVKRYTRGRLEGEGEEEQG